MLRIGYHGELSILFTILAEVLGPNGPEVL